MGQTIGRAPVPKRCTRFVNLPKRCIYETWNAYNDVAEGFGLSVEEFGEILKCGCLEYLSVTERTLAPEVDNIFRLLDDDENKLVDSLEFISALALVSGMTSEEKIRFLFAMYDFDETGVLTLDEMVLAFRSTLSGACKLCQIDAPLETEIESTVGIGFDSAKKQADASATISASKSGKGKPQAITSAAFDGIEREMFVHFCLTTPDIVAWIEYFDDLMEYADNKNAITNTFKTPIEHIDGMPFVSTIDETYMNPSLGGPLRAHHEIIYSTKPTGQKQWRSTVNILNVNTPANKMVHIKPSKNLNLTWVYGYNSFYSKDNVYYSHVGHIIYPAGSLVVVQHVAEHAQKYFAHHTDLVTAVASCYVIDELGNKVNTIVASGERGLRPSIHVWEVNSLQLISTLQGFHRGGIQRMEFSPDKEKLATLGMDPYHSIAIYYWKTSQRIWTMRTSTKAVYDLRFMSNDMLISCGEGNIFFWKEVSSKSYQVKAAPGIPIEKFNALMARDFVPTHSRQENVTLPYRRYRGQSSGANISIETFHFVGYIEKTQGVFTGNGNGFLQVWEGRNWMKSIKGHTGAITAFTTVNDNGFITGCNMGKVLFWNDNLEIVGNFNITSLGPIFGHVIALNYEPILAKVLIGLRSSEIYEMDASDGRNVHSGGPVAAGHYHPKVYGLSVHPFQASIVATVSHDKTLRLTNITEQKYLKFCALGTTGHCIAYSPDGLALLVGIGTGIVGKEEMKEGGYIMINAEDLTILHEARDSKEVILDCKFTSDNERYFLASQDMNIYMYQRRKYQIYGICRGHTGPVMHLDVSTNNAFVMSNSSNGELFFWDVNTGQIVAPKQLKTITWEENNCVYSYATQSFWHDDQPTQAYLYGFVSYTRAVRSRANDLIVICDNMGMISVAAYPCYVDKQLSYYPTLSQYYGHSKCITNCTITCDDKYLLTIGESDGCMMQWQLVGIEAHPVENPVLDSLKHIDTIPVPLQAEHAYDGKVLDQNIFYEQVITQDMTPVAEVEEGKVDPKPMMPWQKHIVAPSRIPVEDNTEVSDRLELDYVYGFTCDMTRENLMYTTVTNEIIFFTGNIVIIMNVTTREQRYYQQHHSKVLAMAVNTGLAMGQQNTTNTMSNTMSSALSSSVKEGASFSIGNTGKEESELGSIIATGDLGNVPKIFIWDTKQLKTLCVLSGYHRRGINHLLFSNNGKYLLSVGYDMFHSLAIYDWKYQTLLIAVPTFSMKSYSIAFSPNDNQIVHCGHEYIGFYSFSGRNIHFKDMKLSYRAKLQAYLSVGYIGGNIIVGTQDGNLYRFIDNQLESIIQAHNGPVNGIVTSPSDGICTISSDGFIKIWTKFLECRMIIDMKNLHAITPALRTIDWLHLSGKLLIGTAGCEIFEISSADGENIHKTSLLEGHGQGEELWGLAVNPVKDEMVTVGDDCLLKVWDTTTHTSIQTMILEMPGRCCAFSPDGKHIAVGLGGPKKLQERQFDGKWLVIDTIDYQISHEARDCNVWLRDIVYSPNGQYIAIGGQDCKIYVYNVSEGYSLCAVITQHQSQIMNIDFSDDSMWLRGNCGGLELHYFEAETGLYIPAASRLKDVTWATHHVTMEFTSQGIWSIYTDGRDYLTADCNSFRAAEEDSGQILVTSDNFGTLSLYRYPCLRTVAIGKRYSVSSAPCPRVRFASGDNLVISVTGRDKAIVQWRHVRDKAETVAFQTNDRRGVLQEDSEDVSEWMLHFANHTNDSEHLQQELKKLVTIRPWIGAIVEPSTVQDYLYSLQDNLSRFAYTLALTHVYNLQTQMSRKSVVYTANTQILYPQSHYAITYDKPSNVQHYYLGHQGEEIACLAMSANRQYVASAAKTARPGVHLWDSLTSQPLIVLPFVHRRGVLSLAFSPDGHYLLSVGVEDDHTIALWYTASGQWYDTILYATAPGDIAPVLFATFYPIQTKEMEFLFVSGGRFHLKFWVRGGNTINPVYAEYGRTIKIGTFLSGCMVGRKYVSGSTMGHLFVWKGRTLDRMIRAHERGITNIVACGNTGTTNGITGNTGMDGTVITAAKEGTIKLWTFNFDHLRTFSVTEADIPPVLTTLRSLDVMGDDTGMVHTVLTATVSGEVYEVFVSTGRTGIVLEGHYEGEVHGLCVHPINPDVFLTTGDDCTIRVWSVSEKRLLKKAVIDCTTRCAAWSGNGEMIVMGLGGKADGTRQRKDGAFVILDGQSLRPKYEGRDSRHFVTDIRFSPDSRTFAIASMDHKIYLYASDTFKLKGVCDKHNGPVQSMDFSIDGTYLQSDSSDYEHLYFEAADGQHFTAGSQLRDIKWHDWTCKFGWPVQGIWPVLDENGNPVFAEPTAVHRSPDQCLLAVGDTDGHIKLYRYPCLQKKTVPLVDIQAHIGPISRIRFTCDNNTIISMGQKDRCVLSWKLDTMKLKTNTIKLK